MSHSKLLWHWHLWLVATVAFVVFFFLSSNFRGYHRLCFLSSNVLLRSKKKLYRIYLGNGKIDNVTCSFVCFGCSLVVVCITFFSNDCVVCVPDKRSISDVLGIGVGRRTTVQIWRLQCWRCIFPSEWSNQHPICFFNWTVFKWPLPFLLFLFSRIGSHTIRNRWFANVKCHIQSIGQCILLSWRLCESDAIPQFGFDVGPIDER